jgi:hypothetical protein
VAGRGPGWPAIPACIVPAGALVDAAFGGYADHMDTPAFRCAVQALVGRAEADERLAVMCAETLWWRCHRSLVADALMCRGVDVAHLIDVGRREPHRVRPTMRCGDDGWPVYDVPDTLPLRTKGGEEDEPMASRTSAAALVNEVRSELAPIERKLASHPFLKALARGEVPNTSFERFAGEQHWIISSEPAQLRLPHDAVCGLRRR